VTDQPDLSSPAELDTSVPDKAPETEMEHQAPGWRLSPTGQQSEVKNHVEQLRLLCRRPLKVCQIDKQRLLTPSEPAFF
jgi:hypothetical protein